MRFSRVILALPALTWLACSSGGGAVSTGGLDGGPSGGGLAQNGDSGGGGHAADAGGADLAHDAGIDKIVTPGGDAASPTSDAGVAGHAGNPAGTCSTGIPARGLPANTSNPTTVIGTGTAASCTFTQLQAAIAQGGVITFNCGADSVTIPVRATLNLPTTKNTVIDGGNKVTLDGGLAAQILSFNGPSFQANDKGLTLQHIRLVNGKKVPTQVIPPAPAPCSQGANDGEGGAVYIRDGNLTVIDSIFMNNQAAPLGPDTGGGAIYILGSKSGALIAGSTFSQNTASNGGAVGALFAELDIYDSVFSSNTATGHGANNDDASMCSAMNNGQHEVGSGGNGGALYSDGNSLNVILCGDAILNNAAGAMAFGGGLFFTSDDMMGLLSIVDSTVTGNTGGHWTNVSSGSVTNVGTAVGVNAKSITVARSTIQGYP